MNHGTSFTVTADPNGDITIRNDDGTITLHKDGNISLSTLAPIQLVGETLGKLDEVWSQGGDPSAVTKALAKRGRKS